MGYQLDDYGWFPPQAREMFESAAGRMVPWHARGHIQRRLGYRKPTGGSPARPWTHPTKQPISPRPPRFPRTPMDISHMGIATQDRKRDHHTLRKKGSDGGIIAHANRMAAGTRDQPQIDAAKQALPARARYPKPEPCQRPFVPSAARPYLPAPAYRAGASVRSSPVGIGRNPVSSD